MQPIRSTAAVIAALFTLLALGACGSDDQRSADAGQDSAKTGEAATQSRIRPTRIVSLSPTATEMLFAIGAGPQVIAVDDQSNYPPEAPKTALSGYKPSVEAIAGYKPDLAVTSDGAGELRGVLDAGAPQHRRSGRRRRERAPAAFGRVQRAGRSGPDLPDGHEVLCAVPGDGAGTGREGEAEGGPDRQRNPLAAPYLLGAAGGAGLGERPSAVERRVVARA